jgi:hypothetical protein
MEDQLDPTAMQIKELDALDGFTGSLEIVD